MPSTLLCSLACPPPRYAPSSCPALCSAHHPILPVSFGLHYCPSRRANRLAFTDVLSPAHPALRSTLSLLCIDIDFHLPFVPPCSQLCPCPHFDSRPMFRPDWAALSSSISLPCHLRPSFSLPLSTSLCPCSCPALHYGLPLCSLRHALLTLGPALFVALPFAMF